MAFASLRMDSLAARLSPRELAVFRDGFWSRSGFLQQYADFLLSEVDPLFSRRRMMARVVAVRQETWDTKTYVLRPPARWQGFRPGMHLRIEVEVKGVRLKRFYSISSTPAQFERDGTFSITVKRVPGGQVSNWLFERMEPGQVLGISEASGEFLLDRAGSPRVLLLAAGSGITPIMSMVEAALPAAGRELTLIYYCRSEQDVIFGDRLQELARRHPEFRLVLMPSDRQGMICADHLRDHCPDAPERDVLLCGPAGFMQAARGLLEAQGVASGRIRQESFGQPAAPVVDAGPARVRFLKSGQELESRDGRTLLELAEAQGLKPKSGCRAGICHECACQKRSGRVLNLLTGQVSGAEEGLIQTCISVPQGDVEVEL